ncbi:hypothetical protein Pla100_36450 [Neorhodopirellula pilleata]|uniref:Uncharacterized protein n=1 Tax=Neorhodopirellula pilleata TaxID=2714738 RepID=A0A5C6A561_9BACT|nr:hypothetical protein Pla100_36450 [Neorhodopirellula pilleata]
MDHSNPYSPTCTTSYSRRPRNWPLLFANTVFAIHVVGGFYALYVWLRPSGRFSSDLVQSIENAVNSVVFVPLFMMLLFGPVTLATLAYYFASHRKRCLRFLTVSLGIASFQFYLALPYARW